jgi:hypothetical protein
MVLTRFVSCTLSALPAINYVLAGLEVARSHPRTSMIIQGFEFLQGHGSCLQLLLAKVIEVYFNIIMAYWNMNLYDLHKHGILRCTELYNLFNILRLYLLH